MKRVAQVLTVVAGAAVGCSEPVRGLVSARDGATDVGSVPATETGARDAGAQVDSNVVDRPPVRGVRNVVLTGAPADSPMRFDGRADAARAPTWVYPEDGTIVPPNLPGFEVHFLPGTGNNLFEVSFAGDVTTIRVYTRCATVANGCALALDAEVFDMIASAGRAGGRLRMTIRGTNTESPGAVGASAERSLGLTQSDLRGGVYYWASSAVGRVVRYDFGRAGARPEVFMQGPNPFLCVGCHALSRDGTRMAVGYGIPGPAQTQFIDVATRMQRGSNIGSNFGSFSPDNRRYISSDGNTLSLFNGDTAMPMQGLAAGTTGSHPDWSPNGDQVVFSRPRQALPLGTPGHEAPADLMLMRWMTTTFGGPRPLVESRGENNYYPGFSPDGQWVIFNRSAGGSNQAPDASLWAVRADGTGQPVLLARANGQGNLANSWPKWTPFVERYVGELEEPLMWVTFSSRRDYGLRIQQQSLPQDMRRTQLWMAAFRPSGAGTDPSAPAFWLPFQSLDSPEGNHIAQWVETVRRQDCTMDRNCPAGEVCQNGRCVGAPP